jgi:hypothetical protein
MRSLGITAASLAIWLALAPPIASADPPGAAIPPNGRLILSISATVDRQNFFHVLCFRQLDGPKRGSVRFEINGKPVPVWNTLTPLAGNFDEPPVDPRQLPPPPNGYFYTGLPLRGAVYVLSLPPGRYLADWMDPSSVCPYKDKWNDKYGMQLNAPFEIRANASVYLGEISVFYVDTTKIDWLRGSWAYFHSMLGVRDASARDLEISKHADPDLGTVEFAIPKLSDH